MVSGDVARKLAAWAVPAAVPFRLRFETGALPQERHHAIRLERQEARAVQILRVLEWTTGQPDVAQGERTGLLGNHHLRRRARLPGHTPCRDEDEQGENIHSSLREQLRSI
jgi:hypothetical protein